MTLTSIVWSDSHHIVFLLEKGRMKNEEARKAKKNYPQHLNTASILRTTKQTDSLNNTVILGPILGNADQHNNEKLIYNTENQGLIFSSFMILGGSKFY